MTKRVFYFLPSMNVGGVEVGLSRAYSALSRRFDFSVFYVKSKGALNVGQRPWWRALGCVVSKGLPHSVVTSLWCSLIFGLFFKCLGSKWIVFVHSARFHHRLDEIFHRALLRWADVIAVDSNATEEFVRTFFPAARIELVPFRFSRSEGGGAVIEFKKTLRSFVFVGRNDPVKRLDLVADLAHWVLSTWADAHFSFVLSGGMPEHLRNLELKYAGRVCLLNDLPNHEVLALLDRTQYYVILSDFEGFSMSTYEAAQAGCFVVYRDVGEISSYVLPGFSCCVTGPEYTSVQLESIVTSNTNLVIQPSLLNEKDGYIHSLGKLLSE